MSSVSFNVAELPNRSENNSNIAEAVRGTCAGNPKATAELFAILSRGLRWYILRHTHCDDAEDILHTVWIELVHTLERGQLRDPAAAIAYARQIAFGHCSRWVNEQRKARKRTTSLDGSDQIADRREDIHAAARQQEKRALMFRALAALKRIDREILERFYVHEQDAETIQRELDLTPTQFRLRKSRAKQALTSIVQRKELRATVSPQRTGAAGLVA